MRARPLAAAFALAAAACGDTLVDHRAGDLLADAASCGFGQVVCDGTCVTQSEAVCGRSCSRCPPPPANADAVCTIMGNGGHDGTCAFACDPGLLRCGDGCCEPLLVAAGAGFTCAATDAGDVHCFGAGDRGQLGDGTQADRSTSAKIPGLTGASALSAGGAHACAIVGDETLCWGERAAFGGSGLALEPEPVVSLAGAARISAGASHTCAVVAGAVRCLGALPEAGGGAPALAGAALEVAAGGGFTCALVDTGAGNAVQCWGKDDRGQLGSGTAVDGAAQPLPQTVSVPSTVRHLGAGGRHACAGAPFANSLYCWGDNTSKQLGDATGAVLGPTSNARVKKPILHISAGGHATCAEEQDLDATLSCWSADPLVAGGPNVLGEDNQVPFGTPPVAFSAGDTHTCFIAAETTAPPTPRALLCFGAGNRGQLGHAAWSGSATPVLVRDR